MSRVRSHVATKAAWNASPQPVVSTIRSGTIASWACSAPRWYARAPSWPKRQDEQSLRVPRRQPRDEFLMFRPSAEDVDVERRAVLDEDVVFAVEVGVLGVDGEVGHLRDRSGHGCDGAEDVPQPVGEGA